MHCIFCNRAELNSDNLIAENELAFAFWDENPVSKGHALVIPKKHIKSFFELADTSIVPLYNLLKVAKEAIVAQYNPDGFNIGINDGEAAGRTVHHLHIHIIPRYSGDVPNPRGGVRHIIPGKGDY